jgi:hypothetical protein
MEKIIFITHQIPRFDEFAGSRADFNYINAIAENNIETILFNTDFVYDEYYSTFLKKNKIKILTKNINSKNDFIKWLDDNKNEIKYVYFNKPEPTNEYINLFKIKTNALIIYQCHDLHYLRLKEQYEHCQINAINQESKFYKKIEFDIFEKSDVILTFSKKEVDILKCYFPNKFITKVDLFFYDSIERPYLNFEKRKNILFVGSTLHAPNLDALIWFTKTIWPDLCKHISNLELNIVGKINEDDKLRINALNVNFLGKISDSRLKSLYKSCKLSIAPLRFGSGTQGKVVESISHSLPIVCSYSALQGLKNITHIIKPQKNSYDYVNEILLLLNNKKYWETKSLSLYRYAQKFFTAKKAKFTKRLFKISNLKLNEKKNILLNSKIIAFYLPQYYPTIENDKNWEKGFTEWTNVLRAKELFPGHYQPHIPRDLGIYDLRSKKTQIDQTQLAKQYGIYGFCYYHYFFDEKRMLELPLNSILQSKEINFPFCLCWANENWTRRWDGENKDVLIYQNYSENYENNLFKSMIPYISDPRYIRINGKLLILIYRIENLENPKKLSEILRSESSKRGFGDLYLVAVESLGNNINPISIGFDASLEFMPRFDSILAKKRIYHTSQSKINLYKNNFDFDDNLLKNNFIYNYDDLVEISVKRKLPDYKLFRTICPGWDNSPRRRKKNSIIFHNSNPQSFYNWLKFILNQSNRRLEKNENFVFINAWNEWAEGAHLEPDLKWNKEYLRNVFKALKK